MCAKDAEKLAAAQKEQQGDFSGALARCQEALRRGDALRDPESRVETLDAIAELYDPWSASVVEDVAFYLEEARRSGGPVVELGVGTGRIAVPISASRE